MTLILNIETATEVCSVALARDGKLWAHTKAGSGQSHARELTLLIDKLLSSTNTTINELEAVAISSGPGSYTGLRIGASVAKGICYALDIPLIEVDTLTALASATYHEIGEEGIYIPMIDARRMEVYTAVFENENQIEPVQAKIIDANSFGEYAESGKKIVFSGNGSDKIKDIISHKMAVFHKIEISATFLVNLSHTYAKNNVFCDAVKYQPKYLKSPNITKSKKLL